MAVALVDAALRKGGPGADQLQHELVELERQLTKRNQHLEALVATTRVDFERM